MSLKSLWILAATLVLAMSGCPSGSGETTPRKSSAGQPPQTSPSVPRRLEGDAPGLHNVIELSERLLSGSEPEGDEGFGSLAKLGVKTIVSVDGARPDIDRARANGL